MTNFQTLKGSACWKIFCLTVLLSGCQPDMQREFLLKNQDFTDNSASIINGVEVSALDPIRVHVVALGFEDENGEWDIQCSGTILDSRTILTAAHCDFIKDEKNGSILFGLHSKQIVHSRKIHSWQNHPQYNHASENMNDLAIVKIQEEIPTEFLPIALSSGTNELTAGQSLLAAGYGIRFRFDQQPANPEALRRGVLMKVEVFVDQPQFNSHEFKTRETRTGTCSADSGGPLFIYEDGRYELVGVTSRGDRFCQDYGIYSYVPAHKKWIESFLSEIE